MIRIPGVPRSRPERGSWIKRERKIVSPNEGYYAVPGYPVPVSISSLANIDQFIQRMCSDVFLAYSKDPSTILAREDLEPSVRDYIRAYEVSLDDVMTQINRLQVEPSLKDRVVARLRRSTVEQQLETVLESLGELPVYAKEVQDLLGAFNPELTIYEKKVGEIERILREEGIDEVEKQARKTLRGLLKEEELKKKEQEKKREFERTFPARGDRYESQETVFFNIKHPEKGKGEFRRIFPTRKNILTRIREGLRVKEKERTDSSEQEPVVTTTEESSMASSQPLTIQNAYLRYYVMDRLVRTVVQQLEAREILKSREFPQVVRRDVAILNHGFMAKVAAISLAGLIAASQVVGIPIYLSYHAQQVQQRKEEITELEKRLDREALTLLSNQYSVRFNAHLDRIEEFRKKFWLETTVTSNFYLCVKGMNPTTNGIIQVDAISTLGQCVVEMQRRIETHEMPATGMPAASNQPVYFDNYAGFARLSFAEMEELRQLEKELGKKYHEQLRIVELHEKQKGYTLDDMRANILAGRQAFEEMRDRYKLKATVFHSPLMFFALALGYDESFRLHSYGVLTMTNWNKSAKVRGEMDRLGGSIFTDYLAHESPDKIKVDPFLREGGLFDQGTALAGKLYKIFSDDKGEKK